MAILGNQHHQAVDPVIDQPRLLTQFEKVMGQMQDGKWHTQYEIAEAIDAPQGSVGSQLRNARVDGHTIEKRRRNGAGTWEYRLVIKAVEVTSPAPKQEIQGNLI